MKTALSVFEQLYNQSQNQILTLQILHLRGCHTYEQDKKCSKNRRWQLSANEQWNMVIEKKDKVIK